VRRGLVFGLVLASVFAALLMPQLVRSDEAFGRAFLPLVARARGGAAVTAETVPNQIAPPASAATATSTPEPPPPEATITATLAPAGTPTATPSALSDPVLVGAGDVASCSSAGDEATAALLDEIAGTVFVAGDLAYEAGTTAEFANCYFPSWGRHRARTRPAPGNHEYGTAGAAPYFAFFGAGAGPAGLGYYSYDLGAWHILALNSNCAEMGGCQAGSPQERWLRADLAAHPALCTLAYWHHPRFSSGLHGNSTFMQPVWQALYDAGADLVISGHDHDYERFAPQDPAGSADPARGLREFAVGTGGRSHYPVLARLANSEAANDDSFGVLKLTLHAAGYDWQFVPEPGRSFADAGSGACH
jgi:hypothetical protein